MIAEKNSVVKEALIKLEILSQDERARLLHESREMQRMDNEIREEFAEKRGEERTKQVFKLSLENKTPEEIAETCGISLEKVLEILD